MQLEEVILPLQILIVMGNLSLTYGFKFFVVVLLSRSTPLQIKKKSVHCSCCGCLFCLIDF